jgi:hypothetical protein
VAGSIELPNGTKERKILATLFTCKTISLVTRMMKFEDL